MLNRKEQFILKLFREKIEKRTFDETDVCFFVMFLRSHITENEFPYIYDLGNTIAHRERNKGKAYASMKSARDNRYDTKAGSKEIKGYNGISNTLWNNEWHKIGDEFEINISDEAIKELLICLISALQFSTYKDLGQMRMMYNENSLAVITVENDPHAPYVCYVAVNDVKILSQQTIPEIEEAVFAYRINGELQLIDENGNRVL